MSTTFPDGSVLTKAKGFKAANVPEAKAKRAARTTAKAKGALEDGGDAARNLFKEDVIPKGGPVAIPDVRKPDKVDEHDMEEPLQEIIWKMGS